MKICIENKLQELKKIVQQKAKFQKVMLIFDESVSNIEISEIYNEIKEFCVYNDNTRTFYDIETLVDNYTYEKFGH